MFNRPLIPIFACFAGGILCDRFISFNGNLLPELFGLIILLLLFFLFSPEKIRSILFPLLFLLSGAVLSASSGMGADLMEISAGKKVIVEGTVLTPPRINDRISRFELNTERIFTGNRNLAVREKVLVTVYNNSESFPIGTRIRFPAYLKPFINFKNPGAYNYELSMRLRKISCNASVSNGRYIVPMGRGDPGLLVAVTELMRKPAREFIMNSLSAEDCALYRALLLGEREGIDSELREPFDVTGMGHVLAVSGLHIGIIAWLSFFIFRGLLSLSERLILSCDKKRPLPQQPACRLLSIQGSAVFRFRARGQ